MARTESNYIRTYTGKKFWPLDPDPADVDIVDIAHALSNQCRFTGHTTEFLSVAQHSLHVQSLCPKELRKAALLHDADEAYLVDLATPVKHAPEMAFFVEAAEKIKHCIATAFGIQVADFKAVKRFDIEVYEIERGSFMPTAYWEHAPLYTAMTPREAERKFLNKYYQLSTETNADRYPTRY